MSMVRYAPDKLDILVMTQGIATTQGRTETEEGIDMKLALHYYSRVRSARARKTRTRLVHARLP